LKYVIEAQLPDGRQFTGARTHKSMESVRQQLIRTAPEWRKTFPEAKFRIVESNGR
jgi:hypothetical protein